MASDPKLSSQRQSQPQLQKQQDYFECQVNKVSLYSLPTNVKIDSIDFEQCILECITHKLDDKKPDNGLSKRLINELIIQSDLLLYLPDSGKDNNQNQNQNEQLIYTVGIHRNRLQWSVMSPPSLSSTQLIDDDDDQQTSTNRHQQQQCHCYMQSTFDQIKLCYVNYEMPTMIIWLLLSLPKRVVKNEFSVTNYCDIHHHSTSTQSLSSSLSSSSSSSESSTLFALVWKCFNEQDVVQLREVYKYLQSLRRLNQTPSSSSSSLISDGHLDLSFIDHYHNQQQHDIHSYIYPPSSQFTVGGGGGGNGCSSSTSIITLNRLNHPRCIINNNIIRNDEIVETATTRESSSPSSSSYLNITTTNTTMNNNKIFSPIDINESNNNNNGGNTLMMISTKTFSGHHHRSSSSSSSSSTLIALDEQQRIRQRQPAKIIHESKDDDNNRKSTNIGNQPQYLVETKMMDNKSIKKTNVNNNTQSTTMYNGYHRMNGSTINTQSESEFDTTQINLYLRQKRFPKRILHTRSHSVDSSRHHRQSSSMNILKTFDQENISPISNTTYTIPIKSSTQPKTISILKSSNNNKRNNQMEKLQSTTTTTTTMDIHLNSEGSSISGEESSSGEFNDCNSDELNCKLKYQNRIDYHGDNISTHVNCNRKKPTTIMKSVLKKSSSEDSNTTTTATNSSSSSHFTAPLSSLFGITDRFRFGINQQQLKNSKQQQTNSAIVLNYNNNNNSSNNKKNVTFSAYATIQMVDT